MKITQTKFAASAEHARHLSFKNEEEIRAAGEELRRAQNELQHAQKAFDLVTGEPKRVGLTAAVADEISKHFPTDQIEEVKSLIDRECGRSIPFCREASAKDLEHIRLCVLRLSKGNLSELRMWVELANVDQRDVLLAADPLMKHHRASLIASMKLGLVGRLDRAVLECGELPRPSSAQVDISRLCASCCRTDQSSSRLRR